MVLIWILRACMMIAINYFRPMSDVPTLTLVQYDSLSGNRPDPMLIWTCQYFKFHKSQVVVEAVYKTDNPSVRRSQGLFRGRIGYQSIVSIWVSVCMGIWVYRYQSVYMVYPCMLYMLRQGRVSIYSQHMGSQQLCHLTVPTPSKLNWTSFKGT